MTIYNVIILYYVDTKCLISSDEGKHDMSFVDEATLVAADGKTLKIQWSYSDDCWDYTFYDSDDDEIDGGQLGNIGDHNMGAVDFADVIIDFHDEIDFGDWEVGLAITR